MNQAAWNAAVAIAGGGEVWDDAGLQWAWQPHNGHLMLNFPRAINAAAAQRGVMAARERGAHIIGAWLASDVDASALESAGFERGWEPWWMAADLESIAASDDGRVIITTEVPEYGPEGQRLLSLADAPDARAWHAVARVDGRFAGRAWAFAPRDIARHLGLSIASMTADEVIAETDRVVLRPWRIEEADRFFDMHRRMEVARWIGGRPMVDRGEAVRLIERISDELADDPRFGSWAVIERSTGIPAGSVLLKPLPDGAGEIEIGWHLHPDSWDRGLATNAARALLARGFALGLSEVWAVTHLDNQRSGEGV